ncbi:MAG: ABC transporter ATP-binding protein [Anaerolineales bacterium]
MRSHNEPERQAKRILINHDTHITHKDEEVGMNVVQTKNLTRIFGSGAAQVVALDHVSLHVGHGEFVAVMGPSGCGKSTLLHLIGGLDRPTEGSVMIEGQDLSALDDDALTDLRRKRIGFIFQFFNLIPTLNALDNTALPLVLGGTKPAEAQARAEEWLKRLNVAERRAHRPEELSGGERQRIAIARALVTEPSLILADEPTGNLDSQAATDFTSLLRETVDRWERSILLVTHDDRISSYADRVLQMKDGHILNEQHNQISTEQVATGESAHA